MGARNILNSLVLCKTVFGIDYEENQFANKPRQLERTRDHDDVEPAQNPHQSTSWCFNMFILTRIIKEECSESDNMYEQTKTQLNASF